ncbi:Na+/H+ antiporter NhaA [Porphyromonadaceae bacterium]
MSKIKLNFSFLRTIHHYVNSGMLLIVVVILAMTIANSPWKEAYAQLWTHEVHLQIGEINLFSHNGHHMSLMNFINDALMALFFFAVGLEIKRELLVGELSSPKKAMLPIVAAFGGMIVPVALFFIFSNEYPEVNGLPIPMATDIAFSLGILSLFGKRVPISLKIFLTTLAVVDDIGGIIIIALKYSSGIEYSYLLVAVVVYGILILGGRLKIYSKVFYLSFGFVIWTLFLQSGIHPTIAGVLVAFTIPARPKLDVYKYINRIKTCIYEFPTDQISDGRHVILTSQQIDSLKRVEESSDHVISPLQDMEDNLHSFVAYLIMPLFAFANAGVDLEGITLNNVFEGVSLSVIAGLFLGKFIGIFSFSYLFIKFTHSSLTSHVNFNHIIGISFLGGIGFTVSLFIANLSYADIPEVGTNLLNQAKVGIIIGSLLSGLVGYIWLNKSLPKNLDEMAEINGEE